MISNPFRTAQDEVIIQFKDEAWLWDWLVNNLKEQGIYIPKGVWNSDIERIASRYRPRGKNCWLAFIEEE